MRAAGANQNITKTCNGPGAPQVIADEFKLLLQEGKYQQTQHYLVLVCWRCVFSVLNEMHHF